MVTNQMHTLKSPSRFCVDKTIEHLINKCCPREGIAVLDVGCGDGDYCRYFISLGCKGSYLGIDIQKSPLWRNRTENNLDISYLAYNAENLENFNRNFNFIISIQALEHIQNDEKTMKGINKRLEPKGILLLTIPSKFSFLLYGPHGHGRYNVSTIRQLAQKTGFAIEEMIKVGGFCSFCLHFLTWTLPAIIFQLKIWRLYNKYNFLNELIFKTEKFACRLDKCAKCFESGYAIILKKV